MKIYFNADLDGSDSEAEEPKEKPKLEKKKLDIVDETTRSSPARKEKEALRKYVCGGKFLFFCMF